MKSKCVDQTPERKVSLLHPSPAQPFTAPSPRHMGPEMEHEESEEIHQDVKPTPSAPGWREAGMHLPPYLDQIHFREGYKSGLEGRSAFGGNISNQEPSIYPPHTGLCPGQRRHEWQQGSAGISAFSLSLGARRACKSRDVSVQVA